MTLFATLRESAIMAAVSQTTGIVDVSILYCASSTAQLWFMRPTILILLVSNMTSSTVTSCGWTRWSKTYKYKFSVSLGTTKKYFCLFYDIKIVLYKKNVNLLFSFSRYYILGLFKYFVQMHNLSISNLSFQNCSILDSDSKISLRKWENVKCIL